MPLYNEISATQKEDFEVYKVHDHGKFEKRYLTIDGQKLTFHYKKEDEYDHNMFKALAQVFYSKVMPKHRERSISDIL